MEEAIVTLNEVKGAKLGMVPFAMLRVTSLSYSQSRGCASNSSSSAR